MKKEAHFDAGRLEPSDHTWLVTVRPARLWLKSKNGQPYRPFQMLVLDADADLIRESEIFEDRPEVGAILERLHKAMLEPAAGSGKPMRPARMIFDDGAAFRSSKPLLAEIGVESAFRKSLPTVDAVLGDFERHMSRGPLRPSLQDVEGISSRILGELFATAAYFFRRKPWRWLDDEFPLEIRFPADAPPRYAVVMGNSEINYGAAFYPTAEDARIQYSDLKPEEIYDKMTTWSLTFGEPWYLTFDDLDAIEKRRWPIASKKAYPLYVKSSHQARIEIPTAEEILFTAAALNVIPSFVAARKAGDSGRLRPGGALFRLPGLYKNEKILINYPAELWYGLN